MSNSRTEKLLDTHFRKIVPAEGHENALACLVSKWADQQVEIQGTSQIKVTATALALLLSARQTARSCCGRHRAVRWCLKGGNKSRREQATLEEMCKVLGGGTRADEVQARI